MDRLYKKDAEGDKIAVEDLVKQHGGLVKSIAIRFSGRGVEVEDLIQIGYEGLLKAIKRFEPDRGFCFSTYAVPLVMGEIRRFLRDDGAIKVSRSLKETAQKVRSCSGVLANKLGRDPTIYEISEETGISKDEIAMAISATSPVESLYEGSPDEGFVIDKIAAENPKESEIVEKVAILEIIKGTDKKEQKLLYYRYFEDKTQSETAKLLGISQVQVSRTEKKLLQKIRSEL